MGSYANDQLWQVAIVASGKFLAALLFHVEIFPIVSIEETLAEKAAGKTDKIAFLSKFSNLILSLSQEQLGNSSNFPQP